MVVMSRLATLVLITALTSAMADQNAPRLEAWFEGLKTTHSVENRALQQLIWCAWYAASTGGDQVEFDAACAALATGDLGEALAGVQAVRQAYPDFAEAHNQIAIVDYANGNDALSIEAIFATVALEPRHFGALAGLAQLYLRQGAYAVAIETANAALAINPQMRGMVPLRALAQRELAQESI